MGLTEERARELSDRVLGMCRAADEASVSAEGASSVHLRFAGNDVTTNGEVEDFGIVVSASFGKRSASVRIGQTGDAELRDAVAKVQTMARLAPEDPEHMPPPEPAEFDEPISFSEATAAEGPIELMSRLRPVIEEARAAGITAAGFLERTVHARAIANSKGLFVFQQSTGIGFSMTARTPEGAGSGWASTEVTDVAKLALQPVGQRAVEKALQSRKPAPMEAGCVTVILEPAAVRDLIALLVWNLDRREVDEKRSFLNRLSGDAHPAGLNLFGDRATVFSDPLCPEAPCPTHADGLPLRRTVWIDRGVLRNLHVGRFWARKQGIAAVPGPGNLVFPGEEKSSEELMQTVDRGVLVTRFWYIRLVQPETLLYTGLTRDGTFRIEHGKIAGAVNHFRFNESPVTLLRNLVASGVPDRVRGVENGLPALVPALAVEDFHFSTVSQAS